MKIEIYEYHNETQVPPDEFRELKEDGKIFYCECCDAWNWNIPDEYPESYTVETDDPDYPIVCNYCRETEFVTCERCGAIVHEDNSDYGLCYECVEDATWTEDIEDSYLRVWNPKPRFFDFGMEKREKMNEREPADKPYLGLEVELDGAGFEYVPEIYEEFPEAFIWFKRDGSLSNGVEICTHPASLEFHKSVTGKAWKRVFRSSYIEKYDLTESNAGIHIHIGRRFYKEDCNMEEIEKIAILLVHTYWEDLKKLSRRSGFHWCRGFGKEEKIEKKICEKEKARELLKEAKKSRYHAVNLKNERTIEIRLFNGSRWFYELMAALEFADWFARVLKLLYFTNTSLDCPNLETFFLETANPENYPYLWEEIKTRC